MGRLLATCILLVSCATTEDLRSRAAFDLQCEQRALNIIQIDAQHWGVIGCGRQISYREGWNSWIRVDNPVQNVGIQRAQEGSENSPCKQVASMRGAMTCDSPLVCRDQNGVMLCVRP